MSLIVAAHDEEQVIEAKVRNALALDYPRELLEVIVASDGSADRTVELARAAGADLVLELERRGKVPAQNAGAERASGRAARVLRREHDVGADALRELVTRRSATPGSATSAGRRGWSTRAAPTRRASTGGPSSRVRELESRLAGVTAGNGAIYAVRSEAYLPLGPAASHDLSFPFMLTKRGWLAVYVPAAVSEEKKVETVEGEFARKRRMMRGVFDEVVRDGMLAPRGYGAMYAFEIASHRALRYASPLLHLIALVANVALLGDLDRSTWSPSPLQAGAARRRGAGRARSRSPAAARPLLRARDRLDRRRALGPDPAGDSGGVGEGGGDAVRRSRRSTACLPWAADLRSGARLRPRLARAGARRRSRSSSIRAGPALYLARRVGRDGVDFDLYKLRTMHTGNDPVGVGTPVLAGDPRVTRVGGLLRRFSLDELPNLINVVRGEMSIVGPRPTLTAQVDAYTPHQRRRLDVKPGITGWAQVNGRAGIPWDERIELDVWYVDHRSTALDLRILGRTARLLLTGHGLYG